MTVAVGEVLRAKRLEIGLTLQNVADQSGLDLGTINRIERERQQPTLQTIVRVCGVLGIAADAFDQAPTDTVIAKFFNIRGRLTQIDHEALLTEQDVTAFVDFFHANPHRGRVVLADVINSGKQLLRQGPRDTEALDSNTYSEESRVVPADVDEYLERSRFARRELRYPGLQLITIRNLYESQGVLLAQDVERYMYLITGFSIGKKPSYNELRTRLTTTSIERIKFMDVVTLHEMFGKDFQFLGMYWQACKFNDTITASRPEQQARELVPYGKLASVFILAARWLLHLSGEPTSHEYYRAWLHQFRRTVVTTTTEPEG